MMSLTNEGSTKDQLQYQSHTKSYLVIKLRNFLASARSTPSTKQTDAVQEFRKLYRHSLPAWASKLDPYLATFRLWKFLVGDTFHPRAMTNFGYNLETYFTLFDELFFFGSLRGACKLHIQDQVYQNNEEVWGLCTFPTPQEPWCKIYISREPGFFHGLNGLLSTLLHEMEHAYFQLYSRDDVVNFLRRGIESAWLGHGAHWQELALNIEITAQQLLGRKFKLGREHSLASDLVTYKMDFKSFDIKPEWKIDHKELKRCLGV